MKCENCGKEEACFQYTSNINGNITEKYLCEACAGSLGYIGGAPKESEKSFEEIFAELFGFTPNKRMFSGYGLVIPTFVIPTVIVSSGIKAPETDGKLEEKSDVKPAVDEEMKRRREINIIREQMRMAAEAEDFEKAAQLRDTVRKLENKENS